MPINSRVSIFKMPSFLACIEVQGRRYYLADAGCKKTRAAWLDSLLHLLNSPNIGVFLSFLSSEPFYHRFFSACFCVRPLDMGYSNNLTRWRLTSFLGTHQVFFQ